ncbi:MAG: transglutaminase-like domain-containing protein [Planctomycetota bacterium]
MKIEIRESCVETTAGEPVSFRASQKLGAVATRTVGRIEKTGAVSGTMRSLGNTSRLNGTWQEGAVMAEGLRLLKLKKGLRNGTMYEAIMFSPSLLHSVAVQICVGPKIKIDLLGRVVAATEITTTTLMPQVATTVSTSYVDGDLRLLKHITQIEGVDMTMIRCAKEFARSRDDVVELIDKMFLASPEPLDDLRAAKSITYHLSPTRSLARLMVPSSDSQKVQQSENGGVIVTVESVTASTGVKFPYEGADTAILDAMKPSRFLQSDHEQVIDLAKRAVGETDDAAEAARRIEAFVAEYIENRGLSVGYASAAEVAASKQGDCSEFAVLAAAMCRSVGIPTQVVVGVAYVSDIAGRQGFRAHVWMRAYMGDKWIGFDPAFKAIGLGGYGAGHIALAIGDGEPGDFFKLETTLARFKIEKLIVNRK